MYKKLSTRKLFEHPRLVVEEDKVELGPGKTIDYLRYGYGGDGVVLVAKNEKEEILFNREYSYVPDRVLLQLPMGKIEDGESPEVAGNRELQEETGKKANKIEVKGSYFQNHRRSDSKGIVLLATDLVASELQGETEEEGIEGNVWIPAQQIGSLITAGEIVDADTLSSLRICEL
jgi:ADP-ribose pyrophosphatase